MQSQNFTCTVTVEQSPSVVFDAVNNVHGWWTGEIEGDTIALGDEFTYRYPGHHYSKQRVTEIAPGEKVVWLVVDSRLEGFENPSEWTGTEVIFEISSNDDRTEVRFSHLGLVSESECFDSCSSAWGFFVNASLKRLITDGEGPTAPPWA
jgi:hypothetical protein